jgi:hypothetical protein
MSDALKPNGAHLANPIIIIGCNRSGTTLLFRNLGAHPALWSLYIESQDIFYRHYPIQPDEGDRIIDGPTPLVVENIYRYFFDHTNNKEFFKDTFGIRSLPGKLFQRPLMSIFKKRPLRIVEKTPANCLRIPFLQKLFPDAKFIFVIRRGEDVVSSLMEGWKNWSQIDSKEWHLTKWHYIVPPGWQDWRNRSLQEICAFQWCESNRIAWADLNRCGCDFIMAKHEDLMLDPQNQYDRILNFCQLPPSQYFKTVIANTKNRIFTSGGSKPKPQKWRKLHYQEIMSIRPMIAPVMAKFYHD